VALQADTKNKSFGHWGLVYLKIPTLHFFQCIIMAIMTVSQKSDIGRIQTHMI